MNHTCSGCVCKRMALLLKFSIWDLRRRLEKQT
jgi:hypothetical protein